MSSVSESDDGQGQAAAVTATSPDDKNSVVMASTKTFKWTVWNCGQHQNTNCVEFPAEPTLGLPTMTLKLTLKYVNYPDRLKLHYECIGMDGEATPLYKARVSTSHDNGMPERIHESALLSTGGSCLIPLNYLYTCVTLEISLDFYCNRDVGAINFPGDSWNEEHNPTLMVDLLKTAHYADVKLISSDGQEFQAHKLILRGKSEVFDAMFRHDMKESTTGVVKLDDMSARAVKFLLHFIYTSQTLKISANGSDESGKGATIEEVLYLADKFAMTELKNYLGKNIMEFCNEDNAWCLFKLCKMHSLENGKDKIFRFMYEKKPEFMKEFMWSHA